MRPRALLERHAVEALAVVLAVLGQAELWMRAGGPSAGGEIVAVVATVPLMLRRRFPFGAPVVVFVGLAVVSLVSATAVTGGPSATLFALMLAFWAAGAQPLRHQAVACAAVGLAAVVVMVARGHRGGVVATGDLELSLFVWSVIAVGLPAGAFALHARAERAADVQRRAERLEQEHDARTRAAVAAERARIARDLHDVIAHSVTVMTVQVGAARLLLDGDPCRAREPLRVVEETGRQALADVRRLVGVAHDTERRPELAPQPGLRDLGALAAQLRQAGLPTHLVVEGEPAATAPGVELAAYRVVQEALTNALKHAGPARARVTLRYEARALRLEVVDDGPGMPARAPAGHGLFGMRERVGLYGGELEVGPRPGGGFAVRARLPIEPSGAPAGDPAAGACAPGEPAG